MRTTAPRDNTRFESQFERLGPRAQRSYPNEHLVAFFGRYLFKLPAEQRRTTRILELGCGGGGNLWMVAREGFDAFGIDLSPTGVKLCRERLCLWSTNACLAIANMRSLPFNEGAFDVIFEVHSLQHLDRAGHEQACNEVRRCLRPDGLFFSFHLGTQSHSLVHGGGVSLDEMTIDNVANPDSPYAGDGLVSFVDRERAAALFEGAGLSVESIDRVLRLQGVPEVTTEYIVSVCRKRTNGDHRRR